MVILAAIDKSERASEVIDQADRLAEKFEEEIHVAHVMKKSEVIESKESDLDGVEDTKTDDMRAIAKNVGQNILGDCSTTAELKIVGLVGNPADEIIRYARETDSTYIVVSPKRQSQTGKILFGSVAQSILLNAHCPVVSFTNI